MTPHAATTSPPPQRLATNAHWTQGVLLSGVPAIFVMTLVALAPIIPKLLVVFATLPNNRVLVPMAVALPTLAIAFSSIGSGMLGERIGRRRLLEISTLIFAVMAILPFWLNSFLLIVLSRATAGLALGAMMTCGVGLTGDYFSGAVRQRWLAIQGGVSGIAGVATSAVAGVLGDINWRWPFLLLGVALPLFLAFLLLPARHATTPEGQHEEEAAEESAARPIPWATVLTIFALAIFGSLIIFPPVYELGLVLHEKQLGEATLAGFATAALSAGSIGGSLGVAVLRRLSSLARMAVAFALGGVGTLLISLSGQIPLILIGAAADGVGQGMLNPVLSIWLLEQTPALARGRVVGFYTTALFAAQFATPLVAGWVAAHSRSTSSSMVVYGVASVLAVALTVALSIRRRGNLVQPST